jgi:hypothetical protein
MSHIWKMAGLACTLALVTGCAQPATERVSVPPPNDASAYRPVPMEKPLPPEAGGPMPQQPMQPGMAMPPGSPGGAPAGPAPYAPGAGPGPAAMTPSGNNLPEEPAFVAAYQARRNPRIMVFVNRTIQGDTLPKDNLDELLRTEKTQTSTGQVSISDGSLSLSDSAVSGSHSSFSSNGPETYTETTSVKKKVDPYDLIGASRTDYEAIELSLIDYLGCGGQIDIKDSEVLRAKMGREITLRLENNDRSVVPLIKQELGTDYILQVSASPTSQASIGTAVRMLAKMISTTDGRIVASDYQDLPVPMTKTAINVFTREIAENIMRKTANVWGNGGSATWDPIELRIYKVASVDDALQIRGWIQKVNGVRRVVSRGMTGSAATAYGVLAISYDGPPEDLYADLKTNIGASTGLKATDLQNNTIDLEVTGPLTLHTVKTTTETTTVTTTKTEDVPQTVTPAK